MNNRRVTAPDGTEWEAFAADAVVAHGRAGAVLAFRRVDASEEPLLSTVTFNSTAAAEFALRTMSDKDVGRRLSLARQAAATL